MKTSYNEEALQLIIKERNETGITWAEAADLYRNMGGKEVSENAIRRACERYLEQDADRTSSEYQKLSQLLLDVKKARAKLSDERTQANAYIRRLAREDTIKEIAIEAANAVAKKKQLVDVPELLCVSTSPNEAILQLSDWHYGIECDNAWNKYSPEICKKRLAKLFSTVTYYIDVHNIDKLHVANLGDLIAGRIHLAIRLESRYDVITQTMHVSEMLCELLSKLSEKVKIEYYDCIDNHSRVEPNKNDSLDLETLARMIPFYMKARLAENPNIHINENQFGEDIIQFTCAGHKIIGVHGDKDGVITVIDKLSLMTKQHYDLVLTAHLHHWNGDEKNETIVLSNPSLMGTDTYAKNKRLSSIPAQNFIVCTKENPVETIHRIIV